MTSTHIARRLEALEAARPQPAPPLVLVQRGDPTPRGAIGVTTGVPLQTLDTDTEEGIA